MNSAVMQKIRKDPKSTRHLQTWTPPSTNRIPYAVARRSSEREAFGVQLPRQAISAGAGAAASARAEFTRRMAPARAQ